MIKACDNKVNACLPCNDFPIENLSAESDDLPDFLGVYNLLDDPPIGTLWLRRGCKEWCFSTVSQAAADECATQQAQLCAWNGGGGDGNGGFWREPPGTPRIIYHSAAQNCSPCSGVNYHLPFGAILSVISQADADARAASLCVRLASRIDACFTLPKACFSDAEEYDFFLQIGGGDQPWTFSLVSGEPGGLTLLSNGELFGFPAAGGSFPFTVLAVDSSGVEVTLNLTLVVIEITTPVALPDASVGAAYSETLLQSGGVAPISWQVTDGVLPPGLTLDETTGIISGTPTLDPTPPTDNIYIFTLTMQDQSS
jgi:putative Ig domain-containing protein/uncharacterized protein DUF5977